MRDSTKKTIEARLDQFIKTIQPVAGGCIADAFLIETENKSTYFLKTSSHFSPFQEEANGLLEIAHSGCIKTPEILAVDPHFLLLEYIPTGKISTPFFQHFGEQLARLHQQTQTSFGFQENNYLGSSPQINLPQSSNWAEFYYQHRLLFQLKLAEKNGFSTPELSQALSKLENKIEHILAGSEEPPSLTHGDLWDGNFIVGPDDQAYLIDPAIYYGHRETELAMTALFGGFPYEFYEAYQQTYPIKENYAYRRPLYQLYHLLNHLNIFGQSYYREAMMILKVYGLTG